MEAPKKPKLDDFGINEADLNKNSLKDILLSESLSSLNGPGNGISYLGCWLVGDRPGVSRVSGALFCSKVAEQCFENEKGCRQRELSGSNGRILSRSSLL